MKNKIRYSNEPIEAKVIDDFLPSPEALSLNEMTIDSGHSMGLNSKYDTYPKRS